MSVETREYPQDLIARRAYELYQQRNGDGGSALGDWLQAEQEVLAARAAAAQAAEPAARKPRKAAAKPAAPRSRAKKPAAE
ncbi:MAG TPA: DUF2934 domain-containing protein [Pyrinomonadaceae bacterium]|jgi:hypothetical protein